MSREALIAAREALIGHGAECKEVNDALALIEKTLEQKSYIMKSTMDMARDAGFEFSGKELTWESVICTEELKAFEALVRADERDKWMERTAILIRGEREACAKVCEERTDPLGYANLTAEACAAAIRAR